MTLHFKVWYGTPAFITEVKLGKEYALPNLRGASIKAFSDYSLDAANLQWRSALGLKSKKIFQFFAAMGYLRLQQICSLT